MVAVSLFLVLCQMTSLFNMVRTAWQFLREISGEEDYGRYRAHVIAQGGIPLAPCAFYLDQLRRKYSRINRCC